MISTTKCDDVLTITINRPEKKNALTPSMYKDMAEAINNACDSGMRVVVIQGVEGIFTSGNDVSAFVVGDEDLANSTTYAFMQALLSCELPVVAKVEGMAVGIGTTMLLHCDFVFAHENTRFAMPFINLGLVPEYASSYLIPRFSGYLNAAKLLMLGEFFDVKTAKACEIISQSCTDDLQSTVDEIVGKLICKPRSALIETKRLLKGDMSSIKAHIDDELKVFALAMQRPAAQEAFSAFLEKRPINQSIFKE
ncbi:MAG: enoyl-CoA hydratase-related protein [Pseudomonadota bacterium]